jgi:hypothetical protein
MARGALNARPSPSTNDAGFFRHRVGRRQEWLGKMSLLWFIVSVYGIVFRLMEFPPLAEYFRARVHPVLVLTRERRAAVTSALAQTGPDQP